MTIFQSLDHRKILRQALEKRTPAVTFSRLAEVIGVQKTYVSREMAEEACFNAEVFIQIIKETQPYGDSGRKPEFKSYLQRTKLECPGALTP